MIYSNVQARQWLHVCLCISTYLSLLVYTNTLCICRQTYTDTDTHKQATEDRQTQSLTHKREEHNPYEFSPVPLDTSWSHSSKPGASLPGDGHFWNENETAPGEGPLVAALRPRCPRHQVTRAPLTAGCPPRDRHRQVSTQFWRVPLPCTTFMAGL